MADTETQLHAITFGGSAGGMKEGTAAAEDDAEVLIDSTFSATQGSGALAAALTIWALSTEVPAFGGISQTVWKR